MKTLAQKLADRIKKEFDVEVIPVIHRTRAGYWQRSAGAFSWFMLTKENQNIGSQGPAKDVLKAKELSNTWTDNSQMAIDIEEPDNPRVFDTTRRTFLKRETENYEKRN